MADQHVRQPDPNPRPEAVGLSPELLGQIRATLLAAGAFSSQAQLASLFVDRRLSPWRHYLPEAESAGERVDAVIAYLAVRHDEEGNNGLVLLLEAVHARLQPGDGARPALARLAEAAAVQLPTAEKGTTPPAPAPVPPARRTRLLAALLLPLLLLMLAGAWQLRQRAAAASKEMKGEFNVAIAQFGQIGPDGGRAETADAAALSYWLFERLQQEFDNADLELVPEVWHDSLNGVSLGVVPGSTAEARAEAARTLAEKIGADILIYGNLQAEEAPANFIPEFYVAELPEAEELLGAYRLGSAIPLSLPLDSAGSRLAANRALSARARALVLFTLGLAWEFTGEPAEALAYFREAAAVEGWEEEAGKEVLHLFIGREAYLLWQEGEVEEADVVAAFERALAINPKYARAYIGLGNVHREKAERLFATIAARGYPLAGEEESLVLAFEQESNRALAAYAQAMEHAEQALTVVKVHLAQAGLHNRLASFYRLVQDPATAAAQLSLAAQENRLALVLANEDDHPHRTNAYLGLGVAYEGQAGLHLARGETEEGRRLLAEAASAYAACENEAAKTADWYTTRLQQEYCTPYREAVEAQLDRVTEDA